MIQDKKIRAVLALALMTAMAAPAFAQNRFMDEAKEKAARREENKSVREAEHPDGVASAAPAKPAAPATPAAAAPAAPAEPATPAAPAQVPAAPTAPAPAQ